jgi:hypothetical protein
MRYNRLRLRERSRRTSRRLRERPETLGNLGVRSTIAREARSAKPERIFGAVGICVPESADQPNR